MRRRDFFTSSLQGGALLAIGSQVSACTQETSAATESAPSSVAPFELDEKTIADLQTAQEEGTYTARQLTQLYLDRIEAIDRNGPTLRSVIEVNPDALKIADQLDKERKQKGPRGPLHGIPVLIKDNIDTADSMRTTAGSLALAEHVAADDAFIIKQLRLAGAVLLGKTNLSEWANFRSTHSSSGWSSRGGQVRNPYATDRSTSGSSAGSGAAAAANLCAVAIGTETDGSILSPSSINGLVGIKPTVGLLSRSGIIPISKSQDTAGPMARTVTDAALLLSALTGIDPKDSATAGQQSYPDYTKFLDIDGLKGATIGVERSYFGYSEQVDALMEEVIKLLRKMGAQVIDPAPIDPTIQFGEDEFEVMLYEFKDGLNAYLATLPAKAPVRSLKDLIAFNQANKDKMMPFFGQEILIMAEKKGPLIDKAYQKAWANCRRKSRELGIDATLQKYKLDALIAPTDTPGWVIDHITGDHYLMSKASYSIAAVAGYPGISVPLGQVMGMPVGMSFFGTAYSEPTLLKFAYAFEQAQQARQAPTFRASAG
ncbi:amidase [Arundinibacter roseus]|uniref:Amidase n=1 Tax=Arundinibacter roseus TaxID=2070510 RepID=A0A4R4K965_9BACT|nr:amidase [Arundinibacter roseus]TDB64220.1 amidase [Arundinibacter roseus]